jgi:hypothetical protein
LNRKSLQSNPQKNNYFSSADKSPKRKSELDINRARSFTTSSPNGIRFAFASLWQSISHQIIDLKVELQRTRTMTGLSQRDESSLRGWIEDDPNSIRN